MRASRAGFTIVELLLVLLLGTLLLGAVYDSMSRQERAYGMFNAMAAAQQDTRVGIDLLSAELRELSPKAGDLLMATEDSLRLRALRKFGIVCITDKNNKRFGVAKVGATGFAAGDSIAIYVDADPLKAKDDFWQLTQVQGVTNMLTCATPLGLTVGVLMPQSQLQQVTVVGAGLKFDSIFPGAPIRSFETLSYRVGTVDGNPWVMRVRSDTLTPLFGPVAPTEGFRLAYFDTLGNALTTFPLTAAQRESVARIRVELRARRQTGTNNRVHTDSLVSDIFVRGS